MNRLNRLVAALAAVLPLVFLSSATHGSSAPATLDGPALFERMKSLVGTWQGQWSPGGTETTVTYRLTGNGSVLVEDYTVGATSMATLYHLDGRELMLTHYCSVGNQPRMRASAMSPDGREIVFDQFDITSLGDRGSSERLTLTLLDDDHITVFFRSSRTGGSSGVELERVK